jgi:hypothetical protein
MKVNSTGANDNLVLVAVGSLSSVDPDRINLKKVSIVSYKHMIHQQTDSHTPTSTARNDRMSECHLVRLI